MAETQLRWQAPEFEHRQKSGDWYWAMWIIVVSIAVISVIFNDILLAILMIIGAFSLTIFSNRPPQMMQYEINDSGVQIGETLYPYDTLESFGIEEQPTIPAAMPSKLLIKSRKLFMPLLVIPLRGVHSEEVRQLLKPHITAEDLHEPLMQKIAESLGF